MIYMLDTGPKQGALLESDLGVSGNQIGQLLTPLTRYAYRGGVFAIDNGAFSQFDSAKFRKLLDANLEHRAACKFVAAPDVVGSARRTLECFWYWEEELTDWPLALVAQDGLENMEIPWKRISAIFIGGTTKWKLGQDAAAIVKAAKVNGKWAHIGRVNTPNRLEYFSAMGADSIDGSGLAKFTHMRQAMRDGNLFRTGLGVTDKEIEEVCGG